MSTNAEPSPGLSVPFARRIRRVVSYDVVELDCGHGVPHHALAPAPSKVADLSSVSIARGKEGGAVNAERKEQGPMDLTARAERLDTMIAEGRLLRGKWIGTNGAGRETACLLVALAPEVGPRGTISACPAEGRRL